MNRKSATWCISVAEAGCCPGEPEKKRRAVIDGLKRPIALPRRVFGVNVHVL